MLNLYERARGGNFKKNILSITSISDTHGFPPEHFFSDHNSFSGDILVHAGDISTRTTVNNHNPVIHICGHVHSARGITSRAHCLSVNAAMANYIDKNNTLLEQTVFFKYTNNECFL